jgi:4-amino-4-deoxy-L-arabinose transferase-like glycosyltransferase
MKPGLERRSLSVPLWLVWLAAAGFVLAGLGSTGILDNNEGLYAEIPREMLASHDWRHWIIPHLNGLPYMEKPPLLYWLTALSFAMFGESEWSARIVPALSSLACVAMLLWFGRAVQRPQVGRLAALMFVSGAGVAGMSRVLMFDMLLTVLLTGALMCAYLHVTQGRKRWLRYSYALLALALLAKGFVALLLFGVVAVLYTLVMQPSVPGFLRGCGKWFEPGALLGFLAIAVPWHLVASLTEPIFAWFYFVNEHVLRFLGKREPHDYYGGAWWYYLPRMLVYLFPWSFLLLSLFAPLRRDAHLESVALRRFLFLAWLLPLAFFSISSAKAKYYLIAVMPFAAFHLAIALDNRSLSAGWLRALPGVSIGVLAMLAGVALLMREAQSDAGVSILGLPQDQFLLGVLGGLLVLAVAGAALAWRKPEIGVQAYLGLSAWTGIALWLVLAAMEPLASTRLVARYLQSDHAGKAVYLYRVFEEKSSLPFYLKKPVPVIDARSNDLFWGNKLRKNDIIISADQFDVVVRQPRPVAVVVMDRHLKDFRALGFIGRFTAEKHIGETTVFTN